MKIFAKFKIHYQYAFIVITMTLVNNYLVEKPISIINLLLIFIVIGLFDILAVLQKKYNI